MKIRDDMVERGVGFIRESMICHNSKTYMRALLDAAINGPHEHKWQETASAASGGGGGTGVAYSGVRLQYHYKCECGAGKTVEIYEPPK